MIREEIHDDVTNVYFTNLLSVTDGQSHLEDASRIKNGFFGESFGGRLRGKFRGLPFLGTGGMCEDS